MGAQRFRYRHFHVSRRECQILQCCGFRGRLRHNRSYSRALIQTRGTFSAVVTGETNLLILLAPTDSTICCASSRSSLLHATPPHRRNGAQNRLKNLFSFFCLELLGCRTWFSLSRSPLFGKGRSSIQSSSITHSGKQRLLLSVVFDSPRRAADRFAAVKYDHRRATAECANQSAVAASVCQVCVTSVSGLKKLVARCARCRCSWNRK